LTRHILLALIAMPFMVVGCASAQVPVGGPFGWDGLGQDPNKPLRNTKRMMRLPAKPDPNVERQKVLNALQPYSAAWWVVHDEIEAEEQRRVNNKIVICRACVPTASPEDHTGSVQSTKLQ
jgi:hypothetical protein